MVTEKVIGKKELQELTGVSHQTYWRMEKRGQAPARLQISPRRVGWKLSEILEWLASRQAA